MLLIQDNNGQNYATRLDGIAPFRVMKILARANQLQAEGRQIVHMEVGEPDFPTSAPIIAAGQQALATGLTRYTPAQGTPELRAAISKHYQATYGVDVPGHRIVVTAGGSGALLLAAALTINPDASLMMADPAYPCNRHFVQGFNGKSQLIPVTAEDNYQLSEQLVRDNWQQETAGVLVASPANPTGAVISPEELSGIASVVKAQRGHLIVDEIYHGLHYSDQRPVSGLEISADVIIVNSFSKYFGMTGWRLGWMVVPENAVELVEKLAQNFFICPSSVAQAAALAAFTPEALVEMEHNRAQFKLRRDYLVEALRELQFGIPLTPEGAFYVYARLPSSIQQDSEAFCMQMLEEFDVAITPGTDFGHFEADRYVRFSYAQNLDTLALGVSNIKRGLETML